MHTDHLSRIPNGEPHRYSFLDSIYGTGALRAQQIDKPAAKKKLVASANRSHKFLDHLVSAWKTECSTAKTA